MTMHRIVWPLAALALGLAAGSAMGQSNEELQKQIQQLEAKVQQLEAQRAYNGKDVEATVDALLKDASTRSKLMAEGGGFLGGWDDGFKIRSADGKFELRPTLWFQFRDNTNYRQDAKNRGSDDDIQNGFEVRRMGFGFEGHAFTPALRYVFEWDTEPTSGSLVLQQAWVQYQFAGNFAIRGGQMKDPLDHEQILTGRYQLAAERSLLTDLLSGGSNYVQGVSLLYNNGTDLRAQAAFTDGLASANTNFQDFPNITGGNSPTADWGAAARFEYKLTGNWKDYDQLSAIGIAKDVMVIGAGADWTEAGDTEAFVHVVDFQYANTRGLSAYAKYVGRWTHNALLNGNDTYDWGAQGQVAWLLNERCELFARYDYIHLDSAGLGAGVENEIHEITVGMNYYLYKHNAKFTIDVIYLPNGSPVSDLASGVLANDGKNELILRAQFQLML